MLETEITNEWFRSTLQYPTPYNDNVSMNAHYNVTQMHFCTQGKGPNKANSPK